MCVHMCAAQSKPFYTGQNLTSYIIQYLTVTNITNPETILVCCIYTASQHVSPLSSHCKKISNIFHANLESF